MKMKYYEISIVNDDRVLLFRTSHEIFFSSGWKQKRSFRSFLNM